VVPLENKSRKILNAPEAAAYCGSSASTFAKLRVYGGGPVYVKLGRRVGYDVADLDRWLASHRRNSTSERIVP
jgi:predicted DNA-binding transcriptional regulator AlpA